ncbi:MAG: hypothetical protein ACXW2O_08810 [Candidatus Aminicenantales bacterium]
MIPQIPYTAIGIGIAVIFGVWAFVIAETVRARAILAGIPFLIFVIGGLLPSRAGQLITLFGWVLYGVGCIIYLRLNGMEIR